jgi:hypothetical protein
MPVEAVLNKLEETRNIANIYLKKQQRNENMNLYTYDDDGEKSVLAAEDVTPVIYYNDGYYHICDNEHQAEYFVSDDDTIFYDKNGVARWRVKDISNDHDEEPVYEIIAAITESKINIKEAIMKSERLLNKSVKNVNEMGYRSANSGVPLHKKVGTSNKDGVVNYRGTDVFTLKNGKVTLNTGGWFTQTTKDRMNQALDEYGIGGEI